MSCHTDAPVSDHPSKADTISSPVRRVKYARGFSIEEGSAYKTLKIYGDRHSALATATFILYPRSASKPNAGTDAYYIQVPVERVASMSTIYTTMLDMLGLRNRIVAIENADYYNNPFIAEQVKQGKIRELSKGPAMDVEQTLALKPDLIFTFGMGNPKSDVNPKISAAGIPVAISLDHLEETPLARAEWIKFIAAFFDRDHLADSLFAGRETAYNQLLRMTDTISKRPTVLTELKYGDAWYVPGGESYMAHLLRDAGADYLWKEEKKAGSVPLTFETVYTKANHCDFWLNLFMVNSKQEMLNYDERYALFDAFKKGNLYNNNLQHNDKGYSIYWESGMCCPDEVLKDLVYIFHPELLPGHQLKYYKRLE